MTRRRKAGRWAGRRLARRLGKALPLVGALVAMGFLAETMRRKGVMRGLADTALNALPLLGSLKNGIELFTDDWIPDRPAEARPGRRTRGA